MSPLFQQVIDQTASLLDRVGMVFRGEEEGFTAHTDRFRKQVTLQPDEDMRHLMMSARSLEDIWAFLSKRLCSAPDPNFILFSVVEEAAEILRLRWLYPHLPETPFQGEFIPLCDKANHLIKTLNRADTTFSSQPEELGLEVYAYLKGFALEKYNIFSIPLIAGGRSIALITLGFDTLDNFSQAKLSYLYRLRDQLAQIVWNLMLQERLQQNPQLDNLTGLITHSSFHQALRQELTRAKSDNLPLCVLFIDFVDLKTYNERHSHRMGDRAIAQLSSMIKYMVRGIDIVARYGNDEVAVILPECGLHHAAQVAQRIIEKVQEPQKSIKSFQVSMGLAGFPQDGRTEEELLEMAQNALDFAKHHSRQQATSFFLQAQDIQAASDQERIEVFTEQIAQKYGESGSELFDILQRRVEKEPQADVDALMLETVASLAGAMDAKDKYTRGHSQAVANYAVALAHAISLPPGEVEKIRLAAFFHDIGKIGIPETILNKAGPLSDQEREIMNQHPVIGARQILQPVSALRDIVPLVEHHHERWDGKGFPEKLCGEQIPIGARIVSIVDAFHALTSNRPYREALPLDQAMAILSDGSGTMWDPTLVEAFFRLLKKARCAGHSAQAHKDIIQAIQLP